MIVIIARHTNGVVGILLNIPFLQAQVVENAFTFAAIKCQAKNAASFPCVEKFCEKLVE
jgi:hypothetical protein